MINFRTKRIGAQIKRELGIALLKNPIKPIFKQITITDVEVCSDLSLAKVFFNTFNDNEAGHVTKILSKEAWFFRKILAKKINLRITPKLAFVYDTSISYGRKISALIDSTTIPPNEKTDN